jgi:hypothetical protein
VVKNVFKKYSPNGTETPPKLLRSSFITFVRSSNAAPEVLKSAATVMKHRLETQASDVSARAPEFGGLTRTHDRLHADLPLGEFTAIQSACVRCRSTTRLEFRGGEAGLAAGICNAPVNASMQSALRAPFVALRPGRDEPPPDPSSEATHDRLAAASFSDLPHSNPMHP